MSEIFFGFKFGIGTLIAIWFFITALDFLEQTKWELKKFWKRVGRK